LLEKAGLDESEYVQNAFNALATVLDDVVYWQHKGPTNTRVFIFWLTDGKTCVILYT
jgi:hypothetical protein